MIQPRRLCPALVSKATQVIAFVAKEIAVAWYVDAAICTAAIVIFVIVTFHIAANTNTEVMIHYVVTKLATAAAEPIGPNICC